MHKVVFSTLLAGGLFAAACSDSNPGQPSVSFTAPVPAGPSNGSSYKYKSQPVTVSIANAVRTGPAPTTYSIEVASDIGFANKVFTRDNIAEDGGGTTAVTLPGLPAGSGDVTYYWRWRAVVDGADSPMSDTQSFVVQQQIIVYSPTLVSPTSGASVLEPRPTFTIGNADRQGAVGPITYVFQVSKSSDFSAIAKEVTVAEQSGGQTSWTPNQDLPTGTLYWRVQTRDDANTETSSYTNGRSFLLEPFDPFKAIFYYNYPDIASWPETAKITSVEFNRDGMIVEFDRRTGPNKWPEVSSTSFGPLQYTLGLCYNIDGQWHCSAPIQFWDGRDLSESGPFRDIPNNWFYDPARWGPMSGYIPQDGELVAVWAGQGNLRGTNGNTRAERTNFALVHWAEDYFAN